MLPRHVRRFAKSLYGPPATRLLKGTYWRVQLEVIGPGVVEVFLDLVPSKDTFRESVQSARVRLALLAQFLAISSLAADLEQ